MAATSRRILIELIRRQLSGGFESQDSELSDGLINQYINSAIGFAAKTSYKDELQLNGIEGVAEGFYASFSNIAITKDTASGLYSAVLPQQPAGVGLGWDVTTFMLTTGSGAKKFAHPISGTEIEYLYNSYAGCNEIYFWMTGVNATLHSCQDITKYKGTVRMLSTQSNDLDAPITLPDGYMALAIEYLDKTLGIQLGITIDIANDGKPSTQIK